MFVMRSLLTRTRHTRTCAVPVMMEQTMAYLLERKVTSSV